MGVLRMIDTLDANRNVERIGITLHSNNKLNDEILTTMMNKYTKVYCIYVDDCNN